MDIKAFIKQVPLFRHLTELQLQKILPIIKKVEAPKNHIIFRDGQQADQFYMVCKGQVKIYKLSAQGKEQILHVFNPQDILAEVPMFKEGKYPANCAAMKNSVLLSLSRKDLITLIKNDPQIALNMLALQAKRLRDFTLQIESLASKTSTQRLTQYFLDKCNIIKGTDTFELGISLVSLANLLGITRENLSRILNKLIKQKLIARNHKHIKLLNRGKLEQLAKGEMGVNIV